MSFLGLKLWNVKNPTNVISCGKTEKVPLQNSSELLGEEESVTAILTRGNVEGGNRADTVLSFCCRESGRHKEAESFVRSHRHSGADPGRQWALLLRVTLWELAASARAPAKPQGRSVSCCAFQRALFPSQFAFHPIYCSLAIEFSPAVTCLLTPLLCLFYRYTQRFAFFLLPFVNATAPWVLSRCDWLKHLLKDEEDPRNICSLEKWSNVLPHLLGPALCRPDCCLLRIWSPLCNIGVAKQSLASMEVICKQSRPSTWQGPRAHPKSWFWKYDCWRFSNQTK